jgi:heptaprenyl diphosphate synthase
MLMKIDELKAQIDELDLEMTRSTISDLSKEIDELVKAGGKKFRPGLMFLIGKVFNLSFEDLKTYARAVELTHLASLIHDDVIDDSDKRRNHSTLNALRNNTTAILAGDFVLSSIMGELALLNRNELLIDLTRSIQDLADGEWLQYDLKSKDHVKQEDLELICIKKTGSLIRYCCTTPAKIAGYANLDILALLGERIGLIFQMADDIVDGFNQSGRPAFQDITNGQLNYVTLKLLELYPDLQEPIYKLKNREINKLPWSKEQYREAILEVHLEIDLEKKKLVNIFTDLCQEKNHPELVEIFEMTLSKLQSNYTCQLGLQDLSNG